MDVTCPLQSVIPRSNFSISLFLKLLIGAVCRSCFNGVSSFWKQRLALPNDIRTLLNRCSIAFNASRVLLLFSASGLPARDCTQRWSRLSRFGISPSRYLVAIRSWLAETMLMQCRRMAMIPLSSRRGRALSIGVFRWSQYHVLLAQKTWMLFSGSSFLYLSSTSLVTCAFRVLMRYSCSLQVVN